ncbi:MAG: hypothetical protein J6P97_04265 [Bacteroidales bacterium]|nr:hypothetical protein [Bacteroidales bacterium]
MVRGIGLGNRKPRQSIEAHSTILADLTFQHQESTQPFKERERTIGGNRFFKQGRNFLTAGKKLPCYKEIISCQQGKNFL